MREVQDPKGDMMAVMGAAQTSAKAFEAVSAAISYYIETRALQDNNAKSLYLYMKKGGQLKIMECEEKDTLRSLMKSCDKLGIAYKECVLEKDGRESYGIIYAEKNESAMNQLRTDYLVANHKVFQVDQDTIRRFNSYQEPVKIKGLDFAEMSFMKERAVKNGMLFAAERDKDGSYSIYHRTDDKQVFEVLRAGVLQERNGAGKNIYEYMNVQRKNKEDIVNLVHAANGSKFYLSNFNGTHVMMLDENGAYMERITGKKPVMEFCDRRDPKFEKFVCEQIDRMNAPRVFRDQKAEIMGKELIDRMKSGQTEPMTLQDAQKVLMIKDIRSLRKEELAKLMKKEDLNDLHKAEAYYKIQRSIDIMHTKQEGVNMVHPKESEQVAFNAEHEARMNVEIAIGCQGFKAGASGELRSFASQYMDGSITRDQVIQFSEQYNSDIRATMDWREPFDMPDYLDQNNDGILDEFQDLDRDKSPELEVDVERE